MKIICIEEHTVDDRIAAATQPRLLAEASYMADAGSRVEEGYGPADGRPRMVAAKLSMDHARDLGAGRIADMDEHGIDMQIISYSTPVQLAPPEQALDLARAANDRLAKAVAANPQRFAGFATLPWQTPDAAATELERAVKDLGLRGTLLIGRPGHPGATFLDDPRYAPVLAKLSELEVPLYVHPGVPLPQVQAPYYGGLDKEVSARLSLFGWGWHHEAGIQVIRMILSGVFERFPRLQVISGHWGEMVPFYLQRMDDAMGREVTGLPQTITDTYKNHVWVTPSGMLNRPHFDFIHEVIGVDRIIYAVDYPYLTHTGARAFLQSLAIGDEEKEKIAHGNAERLFRLNEPRAPKADGSSVRGVG